MPVHRVYNYRRNLPHYQKNDRPIFVTFCTVERWAIPEIARGIVLGSCIGQHRKMFDLHVAVVMPDHVHLIFTPLRDARGELYSLPEIMHQVKGASAHMVNKFLHRHGPVWQDESFDHVLRSQEILTEKVDYVADNPVRAGLAPSADQYGWLWRAEQAVECCANSQ